MKKLIFFILALSVSLVYTSCTSEPREGSSETTSTNIALADRIDSAISVHFKKDEPGIAAIAAVNGKIVFRNGYGSANIELGVTIEPHMVFRIASITKEFTAVMTMMLVEQGKITLDDDITKYLPDYPTRGQPITIRHLLSHTAGLVHFSRLETFQKRIREDFTVQETIDLFKDEPLLFAPGERYSYSSSGYVLLGAIIEKVSGKTYERALKENIFDVIGLKHTLLGGNDRIIPGRVSGYTKINGELANDSIVTMTAAFSTGGLLSSVDDLAIWDEALYADILLNDESKKLMWTRQILNDGKEADYGLGWQLSSFLGHRTVGHSGSIDGFRSLALRVPDKHIFVAVCANNDSPEKGVTFLVKKILTILLDIPEKTAIEMAEEQLSKYVGGYKRKNGRVWNVILEEGKIFLSPNPNFKQELIPESESSFFMPDDFHTVTFEQDENGDIMKLIFNLDSGHKIEAVKE